MFIYQTIVISQTPTICLCHTNAVYGVIHRS